MLSPHSAYKDDHLTLENALHRAVIAEGKAASLEHEISALHSSRSWRLTRPLRYFAQRSGASKIYKKVLQIRSQRFTNFSKDLRCEFDRDLYLELNPDVRQAGLDPIAHYLNHRRDENRLYLKHKLNILSSRKFDLTKKNILVVSHDASRTGAPILTLNLVQSLVERYNVIVLLLGTGDLLDAFQSVAVEVICEPKNSRFQQHAAQYISLICSRHNLKFALVNSVESRIVLPELALQFVPAVTLLHEFASYTRPREAFRDAIYWATKTVFSTQLTLDCALAENSDLEYYSAEVIPQGRCLVPSVTPASVRDTAERKRLFELLRPNPQSTDDIVILGAGFVDFRKGVDLFIECASRVVSSPGGDKCRFVWIGRGYCPDVDVSYSVYLADQIKRAGLENHIVFTGETTEIEVAYQAADIFLLSSRLDPLPNVGIDAMTFGLPVVCFDRTSGIADFLIKQGLSTPCVARYLDTFELAEKVLAMVESAPLRKSISDQCRSVSLAEFCFEDYVERIMLQADSACRIIKQGRDDAKVILASDTFQPQFAIPQHLLGKTRQSPIDGYIKSWASGIERRKPTPGFHPGIYLESHGLEIKDSDPLADYLRAGQPKGLWTYPVIKSNPEVKQSLPEGIRVGLHIHTYFIDLLPDMLNRLERNKMRPDLFISVKDEITRQQAAKILRSYKGKLQSIQIVPNRGRDIGPFLTAFGEQLILDYDFVGHLHTKKSLDLKDPQIGSNWHSFLQENLLGGSRGGQMMDAILSSMVNDPSIGIIFPEDPNIIGWTKNRNFAEELAFHLGISQLPEAINFPVGTMFWARASVLKPFVKLGLTWNDYPEEPQPYDGSILHALERLFGVMPQYIGMRSAVTHVPGVMR